MPNILLPIVFIAFIFQSAWADWTESGQDPLYSKSVYVIGFGTSHISQEEANKFATIDVQQQISMQIKSVKEHSTTVKTVAGQEDVTEWEQSRSKISVRGDIQGVEIAKKTQKQGVFYSLALLSKAKFSALLHSEIEKSLQDMTSLQKKIAKNLSKQALAAVLSDYYRIKNCIDLIEEKKKLLSAVEYVDQTKLPFVLADLENDIDDVLSHIRVVATNTFQAKKIGENFNPISIQVTADKKPVMGIELDLKLNNKIVKKLVTDENGQAILYPSSILSRQVGRQEFDLMPSLNLSASQENLLASQTKKVSFVTEESKCSMQWSWNQDNISDYEKAQVTKMLNSQGISHQVKMSKRLMIDFQQDVDAKSQGLSENSSFQKVKTQIKLTVREKNEVDLFSLGQGMGIGTGVHKSFEKSLEKMNWDDQLEKILLNCNTTPKSQSENNSHTIAILPFDVIGSSGATENVVSGIEDYILNAIDQSIQYNAVERVKLDKVIQEQSLQNSGAFKNGVELGQLVGADYFLMGSVKLLQDANLEVNVRIVDVKTSRVIKTARAVGKKSICLKKIAQNLNL